MMGAYASLKTDNTQPSVIRNDNASTIAFSTTLGHEEVELSLS